VDDGIQSGPAISVAPARGPSRPSALVWMGLAFGAALAIAASVLAHWGLGKSGVEVALRMTARLGFLLFWPGYVSGALVALFGPRFKPLQRRARELGLAFAAVLMVHLGLIGWLCWIGAAPSLRTFAIFGLGVMWVGLLALFSIEGFGRALGSKGWWVLRNIGMNYIAFDFALDFLKPQHQPTLLHLVEYLPFAMLAVLGPALRLLAWLKRLAPPSPAPGQA